ncbi:hypothetical protein IJ670_03190 [bacterium]|nr:hypothetical protein [bacterium]
MKINAINFTGSKYKTYNQSAQETTAQLEVLLKPFADNHVPISLNKLSYLSGVPYSRTKTMVSNDDTLRAMHVNSYSEVEYLRAKRVSADFLIDEIIKKRVIDVVNDLEKNGCEYTTAQVADILGLAHSYVEYLFNFNIISKKTNEKPDNDFESQQALNLELVLTYLKNHHASISDKDLSSCTGLSVDEINQILDNNAKLKLYRKLCEGKQQVYSVHKNQLQTLVDTLEAKGYTPEISLLSKITGLSSDYIEYILS